MTQSLQNIIDLIKPYYDENSSGGNLHIVLDDGNLENSDIDFCIKECLVNNDTAGLKICRELVKMSLDVRYELYDMYDLYKKGCGIGI